MKCKHINIIEVGPRDGFQNIKNWIPTEIKSKIIEGLIRSNIKKIEITSFVHPKAIPQLKDAKSIVVSTIKSCKDNNKNVDLIALVPNLRGAELAWESGLTEITYVISASESHNKANVNRTIDESFEELSLIKKELPDLKIKLDLATVFGCPYEGKVPIEQVLRLINRGIKIGVENICLCDTIGVANPSQIGEVIDAVVKKYPSLKIILHLHDTMGMGLANILVAIEHGIKTFETALGGLGGCPFAPGAAGNIATEDLLNMLANMNIDTGVDFIEFLKSVQIVKENIKNDLTGHVINATKCSKNLSN